jgi:sugar lactone lactonase YvrE
LLSINDRSLDPLLDAGPASEGGQPDTGPCGDTSSDPQNCGRCGHDCLGGACSGGVCQPVAIVVPDAGSRPFHIAMQDQYVYWTDPLNNSVLRTNKQTLKTDTLYYGGFYTDGVAVDDAGVYFADVSNLYRCNLGGCAGTAQPLLPDGGLSSTPYFVAVDDNGVYWDDQDTMNVHVVPKKGGSGTTIYTGSGDAGLAGLVADGQYVYAAGFDGTVVRIPDDGGAAQQMNPGLQLPNAFDLAVDSQNVYWSQDDPNNGYGTVNVVSLTGVSPHTFATMQAQPGGLAVDSQNLYWTNVGTNLNFLSGTVVMCPLTSCTNPVTLASGQHIPREIGVDDVAVYWANYGNGDFDGSLMRVAKP